MKPRRALMLFLFAVGCFGLGLAAARGLGWGPAPAPTMTLPPGLPPGVGSEPRIFIDAGSVVLHDASLTIHPPEPPKIEDPE